MDIEIGAIGLTRDVISSEEESIGNFEERRSRQSKLNIYDYVDSSQSSLFSEFNTRVTNRNTEPYMRINSTPRVINEIDVKEIHVSDTGYNTNKSSGPSQVRFRDFEINSNTDIRRVPISSKTGLGISQDVNDRETIKDCRNHSNRYAISDSEDETEQSNYRTQRQTKTLKPSRIESDINATRNTDFQRSRQAQEINRALIDSRNT